MKSLIKKIPIVYPVAKFIYFTFIAPFQTFTNSEEYWKQRYKAGGNSGCGSYDELAAFKAEVLNQFVVEHDIKTVIEYGSGDGNQLKLANYPSYLGFDVSLDAIALCQQIFVDDDSKQFKLVSDYQEETAQLTLSLDVIYHLIEEDIFVGYMERLFDSATQFVVIYSSDTDIQARLQAAHVKRRQFTTWIQKNRPNWQLIQHIPNQYISINKTEPYPDFFIYSNNP